MTAVKKLLEDYEFFSRRQELYIIEVILLPREASALSSLICD